jgi:hypothetical protein
MQPTKCILNDIIHCIIGHRGGSVAHMGLVSRLLLAISTEMEFQDSKRLVDILWIIFNELEKVFVPLLMFFLFAGWMKILLGILQEPLIP